VLRSLTRRWSKVVPFWLVGGCAISFKDYPLGELHPAESGTGAGGAGGSITNTRGGTSPSGGSSNGAGTTGTDPNTGEPGGAGDAPNENPNLIDDFEDGDDLIARVGGRNGTWYTVNDGTGMQTPRPDQRCLPSLLMTPHDGSSRALHTFGSSFQNWALIGTTLQTVGGPPQPYDLSRFTGIRFWVRGGSSMASAKQVRLNLPTAATRPGGVCTMCNDHFGTDVSFTSKWTQVDVPFDSLKQQGFGMPRPSSPDLKQVFAIELLFSKGVSFDLWLDDIVLY